VNLLRDMTDIAKIIKRAALEAVNASDPMSIMFGNVICVEPLKINIEQRLTLGAPQLILTNNVRDHELSSTMNWGTEETTHTHAYTDNGSSAVTGSTTHFHEVKGTKTITIHNALVIGDQVMLIRMQGGQKYIVLDKVVTV